MLTSRLLSNNNASLELTEKGLLDLEAITLFIPKVGQLTCSRLEDGRMVFTAFICSNKTEIPSMQIFANCLEILFHHMSQLNLNSFNLLKSDELLKCLPWISVEYVLKSRADTANYCVTIYTEIVIELPDNQRLDVIINSHDSAIGGHRGVSKCYQQNQRPLFLA